jgi:hypothetical protein
MFSVAPGLSALEPMPLTNGAAAVVVTNVAQPSAALATVVTADVAAVSLTLREMQQVHGSGLFSKITSLVKRTVKWILDPSRLKILLWILEWLEKIIKNPPELPPCGMTCSQTDYYSNTTETNEYYDANGNFVGSDESSTGDVFEGSEITYEPEVLIMQ